MKTLNQNTENTVNSKKQSNSNYSKFLVGYRNSKIADAKDKESHLVAVANFLNSHNREFKDIHPMKAWLSVLKDPTFTPRVTKAGNYSLFYTLQGIMKTLKTK